MEIRKEPVHDQLLTLETILLEILETETIQVLLMEMEIPEQQRLGLLLQELLNHEDLHTVVLEELQV